MTIFAIAPPDLSQQSDLSRVKMTCERSLKCNSASRAIKRVIICDLIVVEKINRG